MNDICFVITCMGRLAHLQQTLGAIADQPGTSCVVVDYSCPQKCGEWVERQQPAVRVVRVPDQTTFCLARARNAGAEVTEAPWLCFIDADVIMSPDFAEKMRLILREGNFYIIQTGQRELVGTVLCARVDFLGIGGYDEIIESWGGEDQDLYGRLQFHRVKPRAIPPELLTAIPHDDALRVQYAPIKIMQLSQTINLLYRTAKLDLMRLLQRGLGEEERGNLYASALETVRLWLKKGQKSEWRIDFRQSNSLIGEAFQSTLVYTFQAIPAPPT